MLTQDIAWKLERGQNVQRKHSSAKFSFTAPSGYDSRLIPGLQELFSSRHSHHRRKSVVPVRKDDCSEASHNEAGATSCWPVLKRLTSSDWDVIRNLVLVLTLREGNSELRGVGGLATQFTPMLSAPCFAAATFVRLTAPCFEAI